MKQLNVKVCIPSRNMWFAEFGLSLNLMTARCLVELSNPSMGFRIFPYVQMMNGSVIAELRNNLVKQALEDDRTTHVLFIDDDQIFPAETLHMLLAHDKPIIAANIVRKESNPRTNTKELNGDDCVWTTPESSGIEEVDTTGTGLMLISREVFEKLGENWFEYDISKNIGEDVGFCNKARKAGYKVFIDHDLSKHVKHAGTFYWGHEHTSEWQKDIKDD